MAITAAALAPYGLCGYSQRAFAYSVLLALYTTSSTLTAYSVLPQRIIALTCAELSNGTHCDADAVVDAATERISYVSIGYAAAGTLVSGPLTRFADEKKNRKAVLLIIFFGLAVDQVSQIFVNTYRSILIAHTLSGLLGNIYITLAILFSFIAEVSAKESSSDNNNNDDDDDDDDGDGDDNNNDYRIVPPKQEDIEEDDKAIAQRRRDYGAAEASIYLGALSGPFLGGFFFRILGGTSQQYTSVYMISGVTFSIPAIILMAIYTHSSILRLLQWSYCWVLQ